MSTRLGFKDIGIRKSRFLAKTRINKRRLFMTAVSSNLNFKKRDMSDSQRYTENLYLINNVGKVFIVSKAEMLKSLFPRNHKKE